METSSTHPLIKAARKVPEITFYFWIVKLLTTAMGEATSDYLVSHMDPYIAVGLGFIGLIASLLLQFFVRKYIAGIYWLTVVMVAIFGTMAADVSHIALGISYIMSSAIFLSALIVIFIIWYGVEKTLSIHSIFSFRRELFYWATIIATFALGTAAGDLTASTFNLGYFSSAILFAILFILPGIAYYLFKANSVVIFWFAYIITRPLGASVADWLSKPYLGGLGYGDGKVSLIFTVLIICMVAYLSFSKVDVEHGKK